MLPPIRRAFRRRQMKDVATMILGTLYDPMCVLAELAHDTKAGEAGFLLGFPQGSSLGKLTRLDRPRWRLQTGVMIAMEEDQQIFTAGHVAHGLSDQGPLGQSSSAAAHGKLEPWITR